MSRIFEGFVESLKKLHGPDLAALGVSLQWELLLGGGEKISGFGLSKLGIGMDRDAGVLYFGVVFGPGDLVAPSGGAAKTKSRLRRGMVYGEVAVSPEGVFSVTAGMGPIGALLDELADVGLSAYLVGQFNNWSIGQKSLLRFEEGSGWRIWGIDQAIGEETLAKIAIPLPVGWRVEWDSGHHAPGALQTLTLRPPPEAAA